ncbi:MAG TPA: OB-fold domain-containing protein [Candidatus Thermoplasmatota archaeon]|nr:OB-fold domain-containing protein [Candidatus Thermoplasmatota archaeon]
MAQIEGARCTCGRLVVPARRYCPDCQRPMAAARVEAAGVVETWTTVEVTPEGFDPPVHLAVVTLGGAARGKTPARVIARSKKALKVGAKVELQADGELLWAQPA